MRKAEALLRAAIAARRTGRAMYVYTLDFGRTWQYASGSWIEGMDNPPETMEVLP